uniref:Putative reverse transcriptase domain-containing protein n=1 Tax=Tanacetum cinerariifolium TaxID=118510 RepID=A0A699HHW1_TANCI|nr:putative reverse transcriptase domain-containing protein [Tanacetum cinerariifolium]
MPPKRTSTSAAPAMTQDAIKQLVADSVTAALKAQAATMENTDNLNRNTGPRETPVAKSEEAINIAQRLMNQIIKRGSMKGTSNHKHKFDDRRSSNNNNNNYPNNCVNNYQNNRNNNSNRNNDYRQQQNRRPETFRSYAATLTENNITYDIEMANGNLVGTNTVIQGCTLTLLNQPFEIDLMPIKLGSFDVVIGMDWLSKYHAKIICDEKVVHIPIDGEILIIRGLEDIPVVREFLEVFPEKLPGLPLVHKVEFQIELVLRAAPVARAPYKLAPSEMQKELNMRQRRWLELLEDYDCEIRYHPGKANVIVDALSQKERIKPLRVKSLVLTIRTKLPSQILEAQTEAIKKKTSRPRTYEEWTKHLKYVLMELIVLRIEVGYHSLDALGTQLDMSTTYRPETDGQSERTI